MEKIGTRQTDPQKGYPEEYFRVEKHLLARFLLQKLQRIITEHCEQNVCIGIIIK